MTNKDPIIPKSLPEDHFISRYIKYASKLTDAYEDYHLCMALYLLSIATNRMLAVDVNPHRLFPNIWCMIFGISTVSRKSSSINICNKILENAFLNDYRMAGEFSPEGICQALSDMPKCFITRDEIGGFLKTINLTRYKEGLEDLMCALYDCPNYYARQLKKEKVELQNIYISFIGGTVIKTLEKIEDVDSLIDSGFLARFLVVCPTRNKENRNFELVDDTVEMEGLQLSTDLKYIYNCLVAFDDIKKVSILKPALELLNKWKIDYERDIMKSIDPETTASFYARNAEHALKIGLLIEVGKNNVDLKNIKISEDSMKVAIELISKYFVPYRQKMIAIIRGTSTNEDIKKVLDILNRRTELNHSSLLQNSNLKSKDFKDVINTLIESDNIEIIKKGEVGKKQTTYYRIKKT